MTGRCQVSAGLLAVMAVAFHPDGKPADGYALPSLNPVQVRVTAAGRIEVLGTE